jgi:hypothetical protein
MSARVSRKKRRDGASFGRVLEALTGQTFQICTFIVRYWFFGVFLVREFVHGSVWQGNALAKCH